MQHLSIRFLIGLSTPDDGRSVAPEVTEARASTALATLFREYPALTATRAQGYWKGEPEPSLVVEVVVEYPERTPFSEGQEVVIGRAQFLASEVARALNQEAVGVVVAPVRFTLERSDATEG